MRQKIAGIPCVFQDFLTQPAAALAARLCSEPAGTASEHRSYQQQGMGIKKYRSAPPENRPRPANWYRHTPVARAVADAEQHRSPYFAGGLRARATSQPHATLRAYSYSTNPIWLYPLQMRRQKRPPPRRGPRRHRWGVFWTGNRAGPGVYSAAAMAFILPMVMSPMLAMSSAVKAWRKLSENRICALGGNSSSPK